VPAHNGVSNTSGSDLWFYRPTVEYCEWHVTRDADTGKIRRVTLTSEPPEYWQAMFGDSIDPGDGTPVRFPGDRQLALHLYRQFVSPHAQLEDLIVKRAFRGAQGETYKTGTYNLYNKWNTSHGAMHLNAPPNQLGAEIQLGADGTVLRHNARGELIVQPETLIACSGYGGPNRNSDPTIGATVNALARLGAMVTLVNPVGLYMDHIDLTGWHAPHGIAPQDCVKIARGSPRMIERLVIEVPSETGMTVGDLTIGGEPINFGGQVAECVSVKLVGGAAAIGSVDNAPVACEHRAYVDPHQAREVSLGTSSDPPPTGYTEAFALEGGAAEDAPIAQRPRIVRGRAPIAGV
jgi:hypothetical protein